MNDDLMNEIAAAKDKSSIIMVAGVGGGGGNAVNRMWNLGIKDVGFMVCNTDRKALNISPVEEKIQLGEGLGAGNDPELGRKAAIESLDEIRRRLEAAGTRMLFVTAGMGGGTGTGASPVIAKLAQEMDILTVGIVTSPLILEGKLRYEQAFRGIEELSRNVDSLLVISNENIAKLYDRLSLKQAFSKADDILAAAVKGIAEIITVESDLVNVDFADVSRVMRDSGRALMSVAAAEGESRAGDAARASLESPLLDQMQIAGAKNILLNISTSETAPLGMGEVTEILKVIQSYASVQGADGAVHDANIIWGTSSKPQLGKQLELVVVATGFEGESASRPAKAAVPPVVVPSGPLDEPFESIKPRPVSVPRPLTQVVLGERTTRYQHIESQLAVPAYRTRNAPLVVETSGSRKEVLREEGDAAARPPQEKGGSLFD